ncbi:MAG TPA: hypothetical protein VNH18_13145 [Bryobacteraceae bacterium]|nr:hypothetical protein [Bryobacteraceae bacterium]
MSQALQIFRKDVRYLWLEIGLLLLINLLFAFSRIPDALVALVSAYLIARVVHSDSLTGDRQFWFTRPYRRGRLAAAKLLFVFVFVCLPIAAAQFAVATAAGFSPASAIPGLLWGQVLIFGFGVLPVVALAALTTGMVPFIAIALFLALTMFGGSTALWYWLGNRSVVVPLAVEWIPSLVLGLLVLALATLVIVRQYSDRSTQFNRVVAFVGLNCAALIFLLMPASAALTAQTWLSKTPGLARAVTVTLKSSVGAALTGKGKSVKMRVPLTLAVRNLPPGTEARSNSVSLRLEWPGRVWKPSSPPGLNRRSSGTPETIFDAALQMDPALFREQRESPLTITGSVYLTLFGDEERRTVSLKDSPANVQDGLRCMSDQLNERTETLICRALFRWPTRLVYARAGEQESDFSNTVVSYSPFPATFGLNPLETRSAGPVRSDEVTIITRKPLVHFRRDFTLSNVRLADFEDHARFPH